MFFLIISGLLLGFSSAENRTDAEVVNSTTTTSPVANLEPIETFLLNSYNYDNPLIIRSRIPESTQQQDIKQQVKSSQETLPNTVPSQYTVPLPYFNIKEPDNIEVLPTVSIPTISDLSALLYADSPYAVGLTSFESNFPTYYQDTKLLDPVPILPVLTPAQLQFSNSWNSGSTEAPLTKESLPTSLTALPTDSNSERKFLIEKVPEVASFTKNGQFSISDIPELTELEAIFKNSTTVVDNIESRIGTDLDNVEATTNSPSEDDHVDLVETTTTVESKIKLQSAVINDIKSNEIENDKDKKLEESVKGNVSIWDLISGKDSTGPNEENVTTYLDETTDAVTEDVV